MLQSLGCTAVCSGGGLPAGKPTEQCRCTAVWTLGAPPQSPRILPGASESCELPRLMHCYSLHVSLPEVNGAFPRWIVPSNTAEGRTKARPNVSGAMVLVLVLAEA